MRRALLALAAISALAVATGGASAQQGVEFTDWTFVSGDTAGGTLRGDAIHITGTDLGDNAQQGTIVDGTDTYFAHPNFSPQLAQHDTVALYVGTGHSYTVTLTDTLTNPVLHIGSLASTFRFPAGTQITKLSGQDTFTVSGNSVSGVVAGPDPGGQSDANGSIRLDGTFSSSVTFTGTPVYSPVTQPDGVYVQLGAPPPGAEPPPSGPVRLDDLPSLRNDDVGRTANVAPVGGQVRIAVPALASQKGLRFEPLTEARRIPVGSFLDTRTGTVRVRSATGSRNRTQTGDFASGLFQLLQARRGRARGLTTLALRGGSFASCRRAGRGKRASAAQSIRRRLRASARGRFRTRGRHSAATVRGTVWLTADRCDGTLTRVTRGRVAVRDFRRTRTILLRAGKSYLAQPRR